MPTYIEGPLRALETDVKQLRCGRPPHAKRGEYHLHQSSKIKYQTRQLCRGSTPPWSRARVDCGIQIKLKCSDRAILAERRSQQKKTDKTAVPNQQAKTPSAQAVPAPTSSTPEAKAGLYDSGMYWKFLEWN